MIFYILAKSQWIIINWLRYPFCILKHEKYVNFYEKYDWKILGFDHMHENKIYIFCYLKEEINSKIWSSFGFLKTI